MIRGVPLTGDHFRSVNRFEVGTPLHRQVADAIRRAIIDGTLVAGETLPGEHTIAEMAGVARATVRTAMDDLVAEGRIVKRSGCPTRVVTPPQVRRMSTQRYQEALDAIRAHDGCHPLSSAFTTDHGVAWPEHNVLAHYVEEPASEDFAARLELAPGAMVLARELIKQVRGVTVQLQTSVIPLDLVAGTPVADPDRQPWPGGTLAELYSVGLVVSRVLEEVRVRPPTPRERQVLGMDVVGPVGEIMRVFYAGDRPVECSIAVIEASSYVLSFETTIT